MLPYRRMVPGFSEDDRVGRDNDMQRYGVSGHDIRGCSSNACILTDARNILERRRG